MTESPQGIQYCLGQIDPLVTSIARDGGADSAKRPITLPLSVCLRSSPL